MPEHAQNQSGGVPFSRALRDVSLAFGGFIACIGLVAWMAVAPSAHAYVGPRPTVELVKVFVCWASDADNDLENQVNEWLKQVQPKARIIGRHLAATDNRVILIISYEVPEWRTLPAPQPKLPAEKQ